MRIWQTRDFETIARLNKPVHDLHVKLYPEYFSKYDYEKVRNFYKRVMENPNSIFFLLEDKKQYLGYVWADVIDYPTNEFGFSYRSLYVHQISVIEAARSKGYGSKLMEKIYQFARENYVKRVELEYWSTNYKAKEFYQKQGFKKTREFVFKDMF